MTALSSGTTLGAYGSHSFSQALSSLSLLSVDIRPIDHEPLQKLVMSAHALAAATNILLTLVMTCLLIQSKTGTRRSTQLVGRLVSCS
ncbi:hypothetical protein VTO73DRAFT_15130 [Trametes versicolor]